MDGIQKIVNDCNAQHIQGVISDTLKHYSTEADTPDDVFKITMFICKYLCPKRFIDPIPTMFTVYGSFAKRAICDDEIHELDIQTCFRAKHPIVRIKSNYGDTIHPEFHPKKKKPKKTKHGKKKRSVQGNGTSFNSQATVTVMVNGRPLRVKIFRKLKYVIPHCIMLDNSDAKAALKIIINTMNEIWPGRDYYINWANMNTPMHNFRYDLRISLEKCSEICGLVCRKDASGQRKCATARIDLSLLTNILKLIWKDENMANPPDREETGNYPGLLARFKSDRPGKLVTVCIQKSGKITINGSVSVKQYMAIYEWCNWLFDKYADVIMWEVRPIIPLAISDVESDDDEGDECDNN